MKRLVLFLLSITIFVKLFAIDDFAANVAYEKAKSFVQKEETLAKAVKEYLSIKGTTPSVSTLISDGYLPSSYSILNDFGREIELNVAGLETNKYIAINNEINLDTKSITKFYDYYYSNNNRVYTLAPKSLSQTEVKVNLSKIEDFVLNNSESILSSVIDLLPINLANKYVLDNNTLIWYDITGDKKFSYNGKDIIIYGTELLDDSNVTIAKLLADGFLSVGSMIYMIDNNIATQVMYLGTDQYKIMGGGSSTKSEDSAVAKLLITPYSGGYLLNGDVYTWGNNENNIITIDKNSYEYEGKTENSNVTIPVPVRLKSKSYDTNISNENYFSSPNRVRYEDFFASSENGTCAISENYELYCTGYNGDDNDYLVSALQRDSDTQELLYKVTWFDGTVDEQNDKFGIANKVIAIDKRWYVLANGTKDDYGSFKDANIYTWGEDRDGFAGNNEERNSDSKPVVIVDDENENKPMSFKDIAISYENDYKKVYALNNTGDVYTWGMDEFNSSNNDCVQNLDGKTFYYCKPQNINTLSDISTKFVKLRSNSRGVIATTSSNDDYYVYHKANDLPKIVKVEDYIQDSNILSADMIANDEYGSDRFNVVWVNENNELKGDYNVSGLGYGLLSFLGISSDSGLYRLEIAVNSIEWLRVKYIDKESICAISTSFETYCWGRVGFDDNKYETISIPIYNTNQFDTMVLDGGDVNGLEIKYPTYISGFNYDFIFK